jgi:hypothetical protein
VLGVQHSNAAVFCTNALSPNPVPSSVTDVDVRILCNRFIRCAVKAAIAAENTPIATPHVLQVMLLFTVNMYSIRKGVKTLFSYATTVQGHANGKLMMKRDTGVCYMV